MKVSLLFSFALGFVASVNCQSDVTNSSKVVCYLGSWKPEVREVLYYFSNHLCTHVIYSFLTVQNNGTVSGDLSTFANLKPRFPNVKFLIAAGGWNDPPEKYSAIAADTDLRTNFANNIYNLITKYNLDGFDLDWEYPVFRGGRIINPADKSNMILLLQQIRKSFAGKSGLLVTAAVAACEYQAGQSYDVPQLSQTVDFISLMTYDLHGPWESKTGLPSPLLNDPSSAKVCVEYWLSKGAPASKLILGIPAYGKTWTLKDPSQNGVGAAAIGPGNPGPITQAAGTLAYIEICANKWKTVYAFNQLVPYAFNGNQWVGFEDSQSVKMKTVFIKKKGLGGAMFWSIDLDDYKNKCGDGNFPLVKTAYKNLVQVDEKTKKPVQLPIGMWAPGYKPMKMQSEVSRTVREVEVSKSSGHVELPVRMQPNSNLPTHLTSGHIQLPVRMNEKPEPATPSLISRLPFFIFQANMTFTNFPKNINESN